MVNEEALAHWGLLPPPKKKRHTLLMFKLFYSDVYYVLINSNCILYIIYIRTHKFFRSVGTALKFYLPAWKHEASSELITHRRFGGAVQNFVVQTP